MGRMGFLSFANVDFLKLQGRAVLGDLHSNAASRGLADMNAIRLGSGEVVAAGPARGLMTGALVAFVVA